MRSSHRYREAGFTLVELMIVVAIIAILAAIAIPQYQDYVVRTQASEGLMVAEGAKAAIWEFRHNTGYFPKSNQSAGLPSTTSIAGKYVSSVKIETTGKVTVAYQTPQASAVIRPTTMTLSPVDNTGSIGWSCSSTLANRYLPTVCRK
ncbi:pilin [Luteibacter yeojuensis]|uniref:Fimbrial protein n=1 Tax=Luteibacter yeojuensis TaxID=345309 RepID=A0A0F3KI41_9GAMM|nr:pilin [Luteibacter yeojuensis]KJV30930.1 fimbrial protein [Luteibacter yeojuensis]